MIAITEPRGRFPEMPRAIKPGSIEAAVSEQAPGVYRVRLEHAKCPDFWLEFEVTVIPRPGFNGKPPAAG